MCLLKGERALKNMQSQTEGLRMWSWEYLVKKIHRALSPPRASCQTPVDAGFSPWIVWVDGFRCDFPHLPFLWGAGQDGSEQVHKLWVGCSCNCVEEGRSKLMAAINMLVRGNLTGIVRGLPITFHSFLWFLSFLSIPESFPETVQSSWTPPYPLWTSLTLPWSTLLYSPFSHWFCVHVLLHF
jgi:hypothetical protein